jgi:uncharacterized tellurite resistance protein B-like protein
MPDNGGGQISIVNLFEVADPATSRVSMGFDQLVDAFNRQRKLDWTITEAFLGLLLSAAMADGVMSPEEYAEIAALTRRARTLKHLTPAELAATNAAVKQRLDTRPDGLREACEVLPEDMRLSLFAHCVDIVLADGRLLPVELHFLNHIIGLMGINPAEGKRIVETLLIKNRF